MKKKSKFDYVYLIVIFIKACIFVCGLYLINRIPLINIYSLAALYVSFLIIIIEIKHKYCYKIMAQSFLLIMLGVLVYLIRVEWIHKHIQGVVQLILMLVFTELVVTTLDIKELCRILKISFYKDYLEKDKPEEKKIKYIRKSFNYPKGYGRRNWKNKKG